MDFTLNLQAAAALLNAAAGAAGVTGGAGGDGASFSDVLAQAAGAAAGGVANEVTETQSQTEDAAQGTVSEDAAEDSAVKAPGTSMEEIAEYINKSIEDSMKKSLRLLFNAMMKAMLGDSTKDKKTDLFSVLSGGSLFGDDDEYGFLMGAELMDRFGTAMELELLGGTDPDDIADALEELMNGIFGGDDETDENTAAEILAAMLGPQVQAEIGIPVEDDDRTGAVELSVKLFKMPKEAIAENDPDTVPEMERLYEEFAAEFRFKPAEKQEAPEDIRGLMGIDRSALKVNDAEDQLRALSGDTAAQAELASAGVHNDVPVNSTEVKPTEISEFISRSVENQITERITEKLFDMKGDNGTEEMIMLLRPENLGQVAVKLVKENGVLSVMLSAQYAEVGKLMADRAAALSDSLNSRDVEVKNVQVVDPSSAAEQMGLNFTNQGFSFGRGQEYSSDENNSGSYSGIDGIGEIGETENEIDLIREAGRWQTTA